jgi:hypothetical protein
MLNLKYLIMNTPQAVMRRIKNPLITILKDDVFKKVGVKPYRAVYSRTALFNEVSTGLSYTLIIRNHGTNKEPTNFNFQSDSRLWVHCSCPFFMYNLEVALKLNRSSDIYDSNGNLPVKRNPQYRPYLCKHLLATILNLTLKDKKNPRPKVLIEGKTKEPAVPVKMKPTPTGPKKPMAPKAPGR